MEQPIKLKFKRQIQGILRLRVDDELIEQNLISHFIWMRIAEPADQGSSYPDGEIELIEREIADELLDPLLDQLLSHFS